MGDLISFGPQRQPTTGRRRDGESTGAQILFFTGVRYQRMSETTVAESDGQPSSDDGLGRKRKRKRG